MARHKEREIAEHDDEALPLLQTGCEDESETLHALWLQPSVMKATTVLKIEGGVMMFAKASEAKQMARGNPAGCLSEVASISSLGQLGLVITRPKLAWTAERPTEPGFYWLKGSTAILQPITIVEVFYHCDIRSQVFVRFFDCECGVAVTGVDGEWYGPLSPPEDNSGLQLDPTPWRETSDQYRPG